MRANLSLPTFEPLSKTTTRLNLVDPTSLLQERVERMRQEVLQQYAAQAENAKAVRDAKLL